VVYRILTGVHNEWWDDAQQTYVWTPLFMLGAGTTLGGMMWELHLPAPAITNARARFWFTERGWDRFGRALVGEGRRQSYLVKVIRRENPRRSQIVYADEWQVALLPQKHAGGDRTS
jgi:hypothetical protein